MRRHFHGYINAGAHCNRLQVRSPKLGTVGRVLVTVKLQNVQRTSLQYTVHSVRVAINKQAHYRHKRTHRTAYASSRFNINTTRASLIENQAHSVRTGGGNRPRLVFRGKAANLDASAKHAGCIPSAHAGEQSRE
jgi:hypothetical protein